MRKRDYNKKTYKAFAKATKKIRNHCSDDPLEEIKMTGLTGEVLGGIIDKPIDTITHKASKALTSLSYDKENDKPYKGSAIYTGWWLILKKVFKFVFLATLALTPFAYIKNFLEADILTQITMLMGITPMVLLGIGVYKVIAFIKGLFE